ncbi:hypothetical protein [Cellulosilyticum ruminicola]|uniref:hypothetical protein n=1 Tax=Cellulosilyticum ruminicola TaxID=425254 RepID=UPI0006D1CFA5|nr:hypothetical protein [Cellulosilyticum ruminicola]
MYLLNQVNMLKEPIAEFEIYKKIGYKWQYETSFKAGNALEFYTYITHYGFDLKYAIIYLDTLERNTLYYLYPDIKIAIHEKAIRNYVRGLLDLTLETFEEVAASLEYGKSCLEIELICFIDSFYSYKDKEDALFSYAKWQYERPLNRDKISKFVRVMEFYLDEILNYFDLRNTIIGLKKGEI